MRIFIKKADVQEGFSLELVPVIDTVDFPAGMVFQTERTDELFLCLKKLGMIILGVQSKLLLRRKNNDFPAGDPPQLRGRSLQILHMFQRVGAGHIIE
jgi:hypothetical protein